MQIPLLVEITMHDANIMVGDHPAIPGGKILRIGAANGMVVTVPMDAEGAKSVAKMLSGSQIVVPDGKLPNLRL